MTGCLAWLAKTLTKVGLIILLAAYALLAYIKACEWLLHKLRSLYI